MSTISSTGSLSSTGIGSGLDVNSIVTKLMSVESQPLTQLQTAAGKLNTTMSAFGQLKSLTATMRDAASALTSLSLWNQTTPTSSDSSAVTATTADGAAVSNYNISVQHLASAQTVSSSTAFASSSTAVGQGTLTIELGSWGADGTGTNFTAKSGSSPVTITIGSGDTSLSAIRDKINAAGAGVTASIVTDASGARLALRSSSTGVENGFRITGTETPGDGNTGAGLAALSYDAANTASTMTRSETAGNAAATINGITVTSASNTLTGVADGLTLNLLKPTTSPVSVNVASNDSAVTTAVTAFVNAYNGLESYLKDQTKYDATTKTAGTLQGDSSAVSVINQLRGVINQQSTASSKFSMLSDVGITVQSDGTLAVDNTKLTGALSSNRAELKNFFTVTASTTAASGVIARFRDLGDSLLGTDGTLQSRTTSLQSMLDRNSSDQDSMQTRLNQTQARLLAQYQALDTSMAQLNATSSYMTNQLTVMNKSTA